MAKYENLSVAMPTMTSFSTYPYTSNTVTVSNFEVHDEAQRYHEHLKRVQDKLKMNSLITVDTSYKYAVIDNNGECHGSYKDEDTAVSYAKRMVRDNDKKEYGVFKLVKTIHVDKPVVVDEVV